MYLPHTHSRISARECFSKGRQTSRNPSSMWMRWFYYLMDHGARREKEKKQANHQDQSQRYLKQLCSTRAIDRLELVVKNGKQNLMEDTRFREFGGVRNAVYWFSSSFLPFFLERRTYIKRNRTSFATFSTFSFARISRYHNEMHSSKDTHRYPQRAMRRTPAFSPSSVS